MAVEFGGRPHRLEKGTSASEDARPQCDVPDTKLCTSEEVVPRRGVNTRRCASKDVGPQRAVEFGGCPHRLEKGTSASEDTRPRCDVPH